MKQRFGIFLKVFMISVFFLALSATVFAQNKPDAPKTFYRYINEQGNKVLSQSIPPQNIRNGYEVVSMTGEVIKVIPPAPPEADIERITKEKKAAKEQAQTDLQLRRNYSAVTDIDSAKKRNLQELRTTIKILEANLIGVKNQLRDQEAHAATVERNGKKVSDEILNNITTLRTEEKDVANQIKQRELEYQVAESKYDIDKKRFIEISKKP